MPWNSLMLHFCITCQFHTRLFVTCLTSSQNGISSTRPKQHQTLGGIPCPKPPGSLPQSAHELRVWASMLSVSGTDHSPLGSGSASLTVLLFTYIYISSWYQTIGLLPGSRGAPNLAKLCSSGVGQTTKLSALFLLYFKNKQMTPNFCFFDRLFPTYVDILNNLNIYPIM